MPSIIIELQSEAIDPSVLVSDLVRKAYLVANKLNINEFESWLNKELNGYWDCRNSDFPDYRRIKGSVVVYNPALNRTEPIIIKNADLAKAWSKSTCAQSIAELETFIRKDRKHGHLLMPYEKESEIGLMDEIGSPYPPMLEVSYSSMIRIIDTVRNIILKWALRLESDGILGDDLKFPKEERDKVSKISHNVNNFYGPVSQPQIMQEVVKSSQAITINNNDINQIAEFISKVEEKIEEIGISKLAINELKAELNTLRAQIESPNPKSTIIIELLSSIRRIIEGATGAVAVQLIAIMPQFPYFIDKMR